MIFPDHCPDHFRRVPCRPVKLLCADCLLMPVQAQPDAVPFRHQETVVLTVLKVFTAPEQCELIPFKDNLKNTELIMAAHITVKGESEK